MNKCTFCITNKISYPLQCPDGLENTNLCVDLVTDQLLDKLTVKGFGVVYNAFMPTPKVVLRQKLELR